MTQLLKEPRSVGHRTEREVFPPVVGPGRVEMPTHPAVPRLHTGRLRFGPAPSGNAVQPTALALPPDWIDRAFEAGWVGLVMACAAEWAWCLL